MTPDLRSYWLLASEEDEALLSAEIARLAARHDAPVFRPHLTLLGDIARVPVPDVAMTRAIAGEVMPFALPVADIVTGESYFRSFYVAFDFSPALLTLRAATCGLCDTEDAGFVPHVSLLYGPVEPAAKAASAVETRARLKQRMIRFDRVALTNSANDVPIDAWQCLEIVPLGRARN